MTLVDSKVDSIKLGLMFWGW